MQGKMVNDKELQSMTTKAINDGKPSVIIVNEGKAHLYKLAMFSEMTVKVSDGKVQLVETTEKHKL